MRKVTLIRFNQKQLEIIKEYDSISECALDLNVVPNTVKNWIGELVGYLGYTETQFGNFQWAICYSVDADNVIQIIKDIIPTCDYHVTVDGMLTLVGITDINKRNNIKTLIKNTKDYLDKTSDNNSDDYLESLKAMNINNSYKLDEIKESDIEPPIEFERRISNNKDITQIETNKFDILLNKMREIHQEEIDLLNNEIKDLQDKNDRLNEKLNLMIIYLNKTRRKLKFSIYEDYITDKTSSNDLKIILENIFQKIQ
jgi:hypothetical protein